MKGCARSALIQLAGYLATAGAVMFLLQWRYALPPSKTLGVSIFAGLSAWLAWSFVVAILEPLRDRSSVRECLAGKRPADGKRAGFVGTIDAAGDALRSPLSGKDCVAWKYEIYQMRGRAGRQHKATYFEGMALVPSVIATPSGSYRLLAVPTFDCGPENVEPGRAAFNASQHILTARFETEKPNRTLEKQWTDDDGAYQSERRYPTESEVALETCLFREDLIRRGEKVYAVGLFSEARGGIVPHPNWAHETRIMKGNGESILRQLGQRIRRYLVGSVLAAATATALLWMFLSNVAPV